MYVDWDVARQRNVSSDHLLVERHLEQLRILHVDAAFDTFDFAKEVTLLVVHGDVVQPEVIGLPVEGESHAAETMGQL